MSQATPNLLYYSMLWENYIYSISQKILKLNQKSEPEIKLKLKIHNQNQKLNSIEIKTPELNSKLKSKSESDIWNQTCNLELESEYFFFNILIEYYFNINNYNFLYEFIVFISIFLIIWKIYDCERLYSFFIIIFCILIFPFLILILFF